MLLGLATGPAQSATQPTSTASLDFAAAVETFAQVDVQASIEQLQPVSTTRVLMHADPPPATRNVRAARIPSTSGRAGVIVRYAKAQVGKRYRFATAGPSTFDCSGLAVAAYRQLGINLPHYTGALMGRGRRVSRSALQPGDLVFPSRGHVGIYVGGGLMVHASNPRTGVKVSTVYAFYTARRIL